MTQLFPTDISEVRVPPQNLDAEQAVLGAMMLDRQAIKVVLKNCKAEDFYREAHRAVFVAIETLYLAKKEVDVITLSEELKRRDDYETAGGLQALTVLVDRVPTAANVEYYSQIVKEKSMARLVIRFGTQLVADAYADSLTGPELAGQVKKLARQATEDLGQLMAANDSPGALAARVKAMLEESWAERGKRFVKTQFKIFDRVIGGLERKKFHLITGLPGAAKSTLIQQMTYQMALNLQPVGYACLDTDTEEIPLRMCCHMVGVDYQTLWSGDVMVLSQAKRSEILGKLAMFEEMPIRIAGEDEIGRTFEAFAAWAWRAVENHKVQAIFVDSAAKFTIPLDRGQTLESGITKLVNDLNSLAKELNIPIVTIHELNKKEDPSPKGSGTWEYVARYWYNLERDSDDPDLVHMKIRKNNNGLKGQTLNYRNRGEHFRMTEFEIKPKEEPAVASGNEERPAGEP